MRESFPWNVAHLTSSLAVASLRSIAVACACRACRPAIKLTSLLEQVKEMNDDLASSLCLAGAAAAAVQIFFVSNRLGNTSSVNQYIEVR
jgi:hypothetical protein